MTRQLESWPRERIDRVRKALQVDPIINREDGYKEWAWGFGAIFTARTKRTATCADCGKPIPGETDCIRVVFSETANGPWAAKERYLHVECPRST